LFTFVESGHIVMGSDGNWDKQVTCHPAGTGSVWRRRQQDRAAACLRLMPEHPRHIEKNDDDDWHAEKPKNDAFHKSSPRSRCQWNY
jgi:hypothetical protein